MKSIKRMFNNKMMLSWLISYLIVFFVPVLSSLYVYKQAENSLETEMKASNNRMLETLQLSTDESIYAISSLVTTLGINSELIELTSKTKEDAEISYIANVMKLAKNLHSYKSFYANVSEVYVYLNKLEVGIASNFYGETSKFFESLYRETHVDELNWLRMLDDKNYGKNIIVGKNDNVNAVDFVYSLPIHFSSEILASVIVRMDTEFIANTINKFNTFKDQSVYVLDSKNNRILVYGDDVMPDIRYENHQNDLQMEKTGGFVIFSKTSPTNSWRYIAVAPQGFVDAQKGYLQYLIGISISACILIGGISILYFMNKNYQPIDKLLNIGKKRISTNYEDDYVLLNELMKDYVDTKERLSAIEYKQEMKSKMDMLKNLLEGKINFNNENLQELSELNIEFLSDIFVVVVFKTENEHALFDCDEVLDDHDRAELVQFIITNVFEELISLTHKGYVTKTDGNIVCIISLSIERLSKYSEDIETAISEAKLFIEDNFYITFVAYVSDVQKGMGNIVKAYEQSVGGIGQSTKSDDTNGLIEKIKLYIADNYANSSLNVASVGENFNITPYYASNVFKRATGVSMLDYIGEYRINKAKEILKTEGYKLELVAEMVGFSNVRTFMRAFAKYEGVTPGQFKKQAGNSSP